MRIFVLGDPHFKKSNIHTFGRICDEILALLDEKKPDLCVCLGDTLDTHERIYLRAQCMATRFFMQVAEKCPLILLIGNHDRENNSDFMSDIHPFVGLECHSNITIVYKSVRETRQGFDLIYVPYVPPGKFIEALQHVNYNPDTSEDKPDLIFCHQEFKGCNMGSVVSTKGDKWSPDFPLVIAGHIHEHQVLPKVIYVGTFLQQNYGEGEDKALMLLELEKDGVKTERIPLKSAPKRKTVHLTLDQLPNFTELIPPDNIKGKVSEGTLTRVILHVDATETKSLKTNPHYRALENTVDKVDVRTEGNKANLAEKMVKEMKSSGQIREDQSVVSLEEIVRAMLNDDPIALKIFEKEVLLN